VLSQHPEAIDDDLSSVQNEVRVGTGDIDTLCVDGDNNAVFIEYERDGNLTEHGLIQLMAYYGWFASDETHYAILQQIIRQTRPDFQLSQIRLIVVAPQIDDMVEDACWALEPSIELVSYTLNALPDGSVGIAPFVVLDTREAEHQRIIRLPNTEESHLRGHENLRPLYVELTRMILQAGPQVNRNFAPQYYITFTNSRGVFANISFRRSGVRLGLMVSSQIVGNTVLSPERNLPNWSWTMIQRPEEINQDLQAALTNAYQNRIQR